MKLSIALSGTISGTVHTVQCSREGDLRWQKQVYVPSAELEQFLKEWVHRTRGVFFYTTVGDIMSVRQKPRGIEHWKEA